MTRLIKIIEEDAAKICEKVDLRELANKHILITGASGLLGIYFLACIRHLTLIKKIPMVVNAAIFSNPDPLFIALTKDIPCKVLQGDITSQEYLNSLPICEYIIHAAGYGQPSKFTSNPVRTIELNTVSTIALMKHLSADGKFLFTSSAEVYTGLTEGPFKESQIGTTNTTHPRSCYIEGKRSGEAICNAFRQAGVDAKSARISLTYGPGTKKSDLRVLNMLIEKGINGKINLMDNGEAERSFLYVSDAIEMMWNILIKGKEPIYNVGGSSEITILELANKIGRKLKAPVVIPENINGLAGAPTKVILDASLYSREFGQPPSTNLDLGLNRTIEWQQHLYQNN